MWADEIVYRIDCHDRITFVNEAWNAFALANGGECLVAEGTIQHCLWDYMHDPETRYLHKTLVKRVREGRSMRGLAFRCDSPGQRRYMTMDLQLLPDDGVEYRCRLVRAENREPVPVRHTRGGSEDLLRMCGWCQRVLDGNGEWNEIEQTLAILELVGSADGVLITHGMCPRCLHDLLWESPRIGPESQTEHR